MSNNLPPWMIEQERKRKEQQSPQVPTLELPIPSDQTPIMSSSIDAPAASVIHINL